MIELIIAILFNTIGCLFFGMAFMLDIMFSKATTMIFDVIIFALFVLAIIYLYKYAIKTLKTQTKIEYFDEIRRKIGSRKEND